MASGEVCWIDHGEALAHLMEVREQLCVHVHHGVARAIELGSIRGLHRDGMSVEMIHCSAAHDDGARVVNSIVLGIIVVMVIRRPLPHHAAEGCCGFTALMTKMINIIIISLMMMMKHE